MSASLNGRTEGTQFDVPEHPFDTIDQQLKRMSEEMEELRKYINRREGWRSSVALVLGVALIVAAIVSTLSGGA